MVNPFASSPPSHHISRCERWSKDRLYETLNKYWEIYVCRKWHELLGFFCHAWEFLDAQRNDQSTSIEKIDFCADWSQLGAGLLVLFGPVLRTICIEAPVCLKKNEKQLQFGLGRLLPFHFDSSHTYSFPHHIFCCCWFSMFSSIYALAIISIKLRRFVTCTHQLVRRVFFFGGDFLYSIV